jgi:basic membrane protein A
MRRVAALALSFVMAASLAATPVEAALRVGLVTDVGKIDDRSFNQSAWEALQRARSELGAEAKFIETTDPRDYARNIAQFAEAGYDVVVTVGFALAEATKAAAGRYPRTRFIGIDQFQGQVTPGVAGLVFAEEKGGFLAGALAAMVSRSGKVGAVLATDLVPPVWRLGEGFRAGARHVRADAAVSVVFHSDVGFDRTFTDPEWGRSTATALASAGVEVIFAAGGKTGNGALIGAAKSGVMGIGVDTDQYLTLPEARPVMLSSVVKRITDGTFDLIRAARDGTWRDGNVTGGIGLAPYHDLASRVTPEMRARRAAIAAGLEDGTIRTGVPPTKPAR